MSAHTITQKLSALPVPLLPPDAGEAGTLAHIARSQEGFAAAAFASQDLRPLGPEVITRTKRLLLTAQGEGLDPDDFRILVREENLVHLHHGVYRPADTRETPLLRALSCQLLVPDTYATRVRFSRCAAAWILGFGKAPTGKLDLDYDRRNRVHMPVRVRDLFATHQTTFHPYESLPLGEAKVTGHFRTALDLMIHEDDPATIEMVREILLSPDTTVTPQLFMKHLEETPFMQQRSARLERAQDICAEVTLRRRGLW